MDLLRANSLEPKDAAVKQELTLLNQRFAQHEKKAKKQFAGMFDKIREPDEKDEKPSEQSSGPAETDTQSSGAKDGEV